MSFASRRWLIRSLDRFPEVVSRLKGALSCIDQCFIADDMLEQLPAAAQVGKTIVGGIDLNQARMRAVVEAVIALSPSPNGFTASDVAAVRSPLIAASATFALNPALCFFRVRVMSCSRAIRAF